MTLSYVEIEIKAPTVELAIEAAMEELNVDDADRLAVEVISEPEKGLLGFGGKDGLFLVRPRKPRKRGRERRRSGERQSTGAKSKGHESPKSAKNKGRRDSGDSKGKGRTMDKQGQSRKERIDDRPVIDLEEQSNIARKFLEGLVDAYGLEGTVEATVDDDVIVAEVNGEQTEALVGVKGSTRSAIHELTRTVLQRYSQDTARLRLDIAGYAERRRQALTIYAKQLIDQLLVDGGEIMLEAMSAADRKVIHDAGSAREGITSYSEGEAPRRFVVLAAEARAPVGDDSEEE